MYIIEFKQTRSNTNVPFYGELLDNDFKTYFTDTYVSTGKFINKYAELSQDGLTVTITHVWGSEEDFRIYENDQWIIDNFLVPSIQYRTENNIVQEQISASTI